MRVNVSGMYKYFAIILCIALAGCSLARRQPEHPKATIPSGSAVPPPPADVLAIPDAVPRAEPRGARGNPPSYVVWTGLSRRSHLAGRALRHVRHDGRTQDTAHPVLCPGHQPAQWTQSGG